MSRVVQMFASFALQVFIFAPFPTTSFAQQEVYNSKASNCDGGLATSASINGPTGLAFDHDGNLFIVESQNNSIRKVDKQTQRITTVAGNGVNWVFLDSPTTVIFDKAGNLYVAELGGRVCRIDAGTSASISTKIAGNDNNDYGGIGDGGQATEASFERADGLAFDKEGNLYVVDDMDHRVRRIDQKTGIITTVVGGGDLLGDGGPSNKANLMFPNGIAFDKYDNMFVADYQNHRIRRVDSRTKIITTVAGNGKEGFTGDGGPAIKAFLSYPDGVAVDDTGNLYFYEGSTNRLRRVDGRTGIITTIAGNRGKGFSGDNGPSTKSRLNNLSGIVIDKAGNIFIAEFVNNRVRRIDAKTGIITTYAGNGLPHRVDIIL